MTVYKDLLPCPFCGGEAHCHGFVHTDGYLQCSRCYATVSDSDKRSCAAAWNTRIVDGHKVVFIRERKLAPVDDDLVWLVVDNGYMYGPCETWQEVERLVRDEWQHDRHLAGDL